MWLSVLGQALLLYSFISWIDKNLFLVLLIFMSRTALSYCSQSVKDRFLLAIFQHLNLVSCVSLSSIASRKRVQRYGLLWNWQALSRYFLSKHAFFLHFSFNRTIDFFSCYFFVRFLRHKRKKWDTSPTTLFRRFLSRTGEKMPCKLKIMRQRRQ